MSPANPQDPQKGKADETAGKQAEAAAESKAAAAAEGAEETTAPKKPSRAKKEKAAAEQSEAEAKPKRTRARKPAAAEDAETPKAGAKARGVASEAEGKAAAETGVDKAAASTSTSTSRRRRGRSQKTEPAVMVRAHARYVRTSARKARLVCDHIRGKDVVEARAILAFTPRAAAKPWLKLLESAVANAEHNHELVGEELKIAAVHADEGPTLKRFRPRAMGRATRIRKRTSHLSITLTPKES
jgi:ribosomal protein L22